MSKISRHKVGRNCLTAEHVDVDVDVDVLCSWHTAVFSSWRRIPRSLNLYVACCSFTAFIALFTRILVVLNRHTFVIQCLVMNPYRSVNVVIGCLCAQYL